jgi:hypothetical protein
MEDYPEGEKGMGSPSSHSPGNDYGCNVKPCGGPFPQEEVKLDPRAPNMTKLLEAVAITVEERVRQLMNYYGLPIPESNENIQVDLSGPTPKIYTMGKMGWKEAEEGDPITGAVIEQLKGAKPNCMISKEGAPIRKSLLDALKGIKPEDVERIEVVSMTEHIPPEVLKRIEKIGMAMADRLGKDQFDIVTIVDDGKGHVATKRTEYIKSNPIRPAKNLGEVLDRVKKDKPYLVKKETFQQRLDRKRVLHKPEEKKVAPKKAKKGNLNFREIEPVENRRVYVFPGNHRIIVENACRIAITDSGIHRLETTTGEKHIIPAGWLQIKLNTPEWSF